MDETKKQTNKQRMKDTVESVPISFLIPFVSRKVQIEFR